LIQPVILRGGSRVAQLKTLEAISVTLRLPRRTWSEELQPLAHHSFTTVSLLRGRLTRREAVLVIRVEGSPLEIQETLHYWKCRGYRAGGGDRHGVQDPLSYSGKRNPPLPSLHGPRIPFVLSSQIRIEDGQAPSETPELEAYCVKAAVQKLR
jgi:hypothetical protein